MTRRQFPYSRRRIIGLVAGVALMVTVCASSPAAHAASLGNSSRSGGSESTTALRIGETAWTSTISDNPYNPDIVPFSNLSLLGLAVTSLDPRSGPNSYYPELATKWKLTKSTIAVTLRRSARWQNDEQFTSADVKTSLLLAGANFNSIWADLTRITTPNPQSIVLHLQSWAVPENVLIDLMQVTILPKSQFGSLLPKGFERDLTAYWHTYDPLHPTKATVAAATNSAAGKAMTNTGKALASFNPSRLIGDGPYQLTEASVNGLVYKKWTGWWDAKAIRVPWVEVDPMTTATQFGALLAGRIDLQTDTQFPDPQVTKLNRSPNGHYVYEKTPGFEGNLLFHLGTYPFNILNVRRAIAYAINRPKLAELTMGGKFMQNPPTTYPVGISHVLTSRYLTSSQYRSLQAYSYDPAKAQSLLRSAGFSKRSGIWYTPKGKPFSVTIYEPAGVATQDQEGIAIAQMLKQIGIRAASQDTEAATFTTQQEAGDYPVSQALMDRGLVNPISFLANFVGGYNYPATYNGEGSCGCTTAIGVGPFASVPGLGRVNIAQALNKEIYTAKPQTWGSYLWDWVRFINKELPVLALYDNATHEAYSRARYTDFPPDAKAWLWTAVVGAAQPVVWQQEGYLRPRSRP